MSSLVVDKVSSRSSRSSSARALLVRAWRERWSDVQFGIRLKTILEEGGGEEKRPPGDRVGLAGILLDSALVGPAPNALVVGYLRHCLASGVVSRADTLRSLAGFDRWGRPHCSSALVGLAAEVKEGLGEGAGREDPVEVSVAFLGLLSWLLRLSANSFEALEKDRKAAEGTREAANYRRAIELARSMAETDHTQAMLLVAKSEDKDAWAKVVAGCKAMAEQVRLCQSFAPDPTALKQVRGVTNGDPTNIASVHFFF